MTKKGVIPECLYYPLFVTPECFYQGSMVLKIKRKSKNLDSRLKISGMTAGEVIPECFYEESKQWKETSLWFTIEGQKEKAKTWMPD